MKNLIRVVLAATLLLGTALAAGAQDHVRVTVPFDFHVQGKAFAAGTYTVQRAMERNLGMLLLNEAQGKRLVTIPVNLDDTARPGASLSFSRYGDDYYLIGVTTASGRFNVRPTKAERVLAAKGLDTEITIGTN